MRKVHLSPQKATLGLCILIFVVFLPVLLKPQRVEKLGRKAIGLWIKGQEIGRPLVLTDAQRVAYYAEGDLLRMDTWNYKRNISEARAKGIKYIVVERENIEKKYPHLMELAQKDFSLQKVPQLAEKNQERYLVFKSKY